MRIIVQSDGYRLRIPVPMFFLSRPMVKLGFRMMRYSGKYASLAEQAVWNLPEEKILQLCGEVRKLRKSHPGWLLVDVESADGDRVQIIL